MAVAFIGLGSNVGDRAENLKRALEKIRKLPKTGLIKSSTFHETDPVGGPPQGKFLNAAAELQTDLEPLELLKQVRKIEQEMGRPKKHERWGPRTIDLDLLIYDDLILQTPELTLPHPRMQERPFVLNPLAEIAPDWRRFIHADRPQLR